MDSNEEKNEIVKASRKLADIIRRHRAGEPIIAEMAARIQERSLFQERAENADRKILPE